MKKNKLVKLIDENDYKSYFIDLKDKFINITCYTEDFIFNIITNRDIKKRKCIEYYMGYYKALWDKFDENLITRSRIYTDSINIDIEKNEFIIWIGVFFESTFSFERLKSIQIQLIDEKTKNQFFLSAKGSITFELIAKILEKDYYFHQLLN